MIKFQRKKDNWICYFYNDGAHPWPYYEGLSPNGMCFTFLLPKEDREEFARYKVKLKNERDVSSITIRYENEFRYLDCEA